jgi:hypothetical protein
MCLLDGVLLHPRVNGGLICDGTPAVEHKSKDMGASFVWQLLNLPTRTGEASLLIAPSSLALTLLIIPILTHLMC